MCVLILDQVADTHLTPPGSQSSELSKSIYRGVSICRIGDGKKAKKVGTERNPDRIGTEGEELRSLKNAEGRVKGAEK
jgi:hypothetical protein